MAKKEEKTEGKTVLEDPKVYVDLATSEEDVVGYDQAGAKITFLKERFRFLSKENLDVLSHDNRQSYLRTKALIQQELEDKKPKQILKVLDPLGGHEGAMMKVKVLEKEWQKKWHLCWKHAVEKDALMRLGYSLVVAGEDPVECGMKPAGTTFTIPDPRSRTDLDLVLMKLPMHIFIQHNTAVAKESQGKFAAFKDKFAADVEEGSKGRLKGKVFEDEPEEKVSLRQSDLRPV